MFIIAGIGLNSFSEDKIRKIILAGADVLRYNFSYRSIEANAKHIQVAKEIIDELNTSAKILIDFPIGKVRLGDFDTKILGVREGEDFILRSGNYSPDCTQFIPVQLDKLGEKVRLHQTITIGDGEIAMQVTQIIDHSSIKVKVLNNGAIRFMKSFNAEQFFTEEEMLEKYKKIINKINIIKPHLIAFSFINTETNEEIKKFLAQKIPNSNSGPKKIIKIENREGLSRIKEICQDNFYDMIMIDRGELGVNLPFEDLGIIQKEITRIAKKFKKPIIVSTQILESTINNYTPYRSDIYGLTNMVLDGVDGIMLCQETAVGLRPAYSISVAKKIIEKSKIYKNRLIKKDYE
ncbi:MAG: hypothetical protein HOA57_01805 [Candidatus Magasanikbacteria bacterium]|jgi:pyruvate kinase|nr:hypothetical protein [Candidatus Magasanikbacteria bacterium]MBT4315154.1 hypothetical protein [Candidatus Magasanikbacteria bacterium]MBT4547390.1 hypothetical protein [Candidatus Magasanikbacteria bacterium]MBT6819089.1 hypothetical protein [Candidatus Magasanikbacteria bacterium]